MGLNIYNQGNSWPFLAWVELQGITLEEASYREFNSAYIGEYREPRDYFDEPNPVPVILYVPNERNTGYYLFDSVQTKSDHPNAKWGFSR